MSSNPSGTSPPAAATGEGGDATSRGGQRRKNKNRSSGNQRAKSKFKGKCSEIKTSVYDVVSGKDTFTKMTREITEYVGREFDDAGEFRTGMVEMRSIYKYLSSTHERNAILPLQIPTLQPI
jgi:hypothetical protein